ncbi:Putative polyhydroxyalkanoic acid system protein (PHA_gran_rgn) [Rhizobiales bacterium GAS113]|nr:Putative polyhydroxyalkanoic acid system protein (PHA_gran_rgn) [Rhizobiales bacterium GAS113]
MSKPIIIVIPHQLGRAEAGRRLKSGLAGIETTLRDKLPILEQTWTEDHLEFRIRLFGYATGGSIDVEDDAVRLLVQLPWPLAVLASKATALIQKQGRTMLEKK